MGTPWRRCTPAVLRSRPGWRRPGAYSRTPSQADASEETTETRSEVRLTNKNNRTIKSKSLRHLIGQNGESPLQAAGGSVFGGSGKPLGVVADLSLESVDVGNDLFGSDYVLGYVDDGL